MITLQQHIEEALKINKNFKKLDNNSLFRGLAAAENADEFYDIVGEIAKTASREPDIYDDTEDFDIKNYFEPWESASGWWDRTYKILEPELNGKAVLGWSSSIDFDNVEKDVPPVLVDIMRTDRWDHNLLYRRGSVETDVWGTQLGRSGVHIYRTSMWKNDDGRDYIEYWILFVLDY